MPMSALPASGPHQSVLLREAVDSLITDPCGFYIDGTFGRGGHSAEILNRLSATGRLLATDRDPDAIAFGRERFAGESRIELVAAQFSMLKALVVERDRCGSTAGVLLDLGVSSPQLDEAERGFSFQRSGPLDMRMSASGLSAADWVNSADAEEIANVLWEYGEERLSRRIARAILRERAQEPLTTTAQLADIVRSVYPRQPHKKDPATRTFQAIRMHINDELGEIKLFLADIIDLLQPGGRLVVISFHSLEDRLIKRFIRDNSQALPVHPDLPMNRDQSFVPPLRPVGKAVKATTQEQDSNVRSRSAVMRIAERAA